METSWATLEKRMAEVLKALEEGTRRRTTLQTELAVLNEALEPVRVEYWELVGARGDSELS